jgi:hypothetical protein
VMASRSSRKKQAEPPESRTYNPDVPAELISEYVSSWTSARVGLHTRWAREKRPPQLFKYELQKLALDLYARALEQNDKELGLERPFAYWTVDPVQPTTHGLFVRESEEYPGLQGVFAVHAAKKGMKIDSYPSAILTTKQFIAFPACVSTAVEAPWLNRALGQPESNSRPGPLWLLVGDPTAAGAQIDSVPKSRTNCSFSWHKEHLMQVGRSGKWVVAHDHCGITTTKVISAEQELLIYYGKEFWEENPIGCWVCMLKDTALPCDFVQCEGAKCNTGMHDDCAPTPVPRRNSKLLCSLHAPAVAAAAAPAPAAASAPLVRRLPATFSPVENVSMEQVLRRLAPPAAAAAAAAAPSPSPTSQVLSLIHI